MLVPNLKIRSLAPTGRVEPKNCPSTVPCLNFTLSDSMREYVYPRRPQMCSSAPFPKSRLPKSDPSPVLLEPEPELVKSIFWKRGAPVDPAKRAPPKSFREGL